MKSALSILVLLALGFVATTQIQTTVAAPIDSVGSNTQTNKDVIPRAFTAESLTTRSLDIDNNHLPFVVKRDYLAERGASLAPAALLSRSLACSGEQDPPATFLGKRDNTRFPLMIENLLHGSSLASTISNIARLSAMPKANAIHNLINAGIDRESARVIFAITYDVYYIFFYDGLTEAITAFAKDLRDPAYAGRTNSQLFSRAIHEAAVRIDTLIRVRLTTVFITLDTLLIPGLYRATKIPLSSVYDDASNFAPGLNIDEAVKTIYPFIVKMVEIWLTNEFRPPRPLPI
ncbi:hypothetical protein BGX33_008040 [Mortierella sp. NVP41]|nr:hypothetical protein BGX33_008040 [Mortierella sp. NVP41]